MGYKRDRDNEFDRDYKPFKDVEDHRGKLQEHLAKRSGCLLAIFQLPILLLKKF